MGPKPPRPPPARTPGYRRGHTAREGDSSWELRVQGYVLRPEWGHPDSFHFSSFCGRKSGLTATVCLHVNSRSVF